MRMLCRIVGLAICCGMGGAAFAAEGGAVKLSASQCSSLWDKINAAGGATIDASQAQGYVTNFKAADPDSDGTLSKAEFQAACAKGLVQDSSSSGAASGTEGSDESAMPPAAESPPKLPPSQKQY